jgi:hypothetical protein
MKTLENDFVRALPRFKGKRGFQDFEAWQIMKRFTNHISGVKDEDEPNIRLPY